METHVNLTSRKNKTKVLIDSDCLLEKIILVRLREVELVPEDLLLLLLLLHEKLQIL